MEIEEIERFATEFVERLRRAGAPEDFKPSIRQSIALARLLEAMKLRKGKLDKEDFIRAALAVTPPEAKDLALDVVQEMMGGSYSNIFHRLRAFPFLPPFPLQLPIPIGGGYNEGLSERGRKVFSKAIAGNPQAMRDFKKLAEENPVEAAKVFNKLERAGIANLDNYAGIVSSSIRSLEDFYQVFSVSRILPSNLEDILNHAYRNYPLNKAYRLADKIDSIANSNMRELIIKHYWEMGKKEGNIPSLREVASSPAPIKEWRQMLDASLRMEIERALRSEDPARALTELAKQLKAYSDYCQEEWCSKPLRAASKKVAKMAYEASKREGEEKMREIERELMKERLEPTLKSKISHKLRGIKGRQNLDKLARSSYNDVYDELGQGKVNIEELLKRAAKFNNREAMAAMAHRDLNATLEAAKKLGLLDKVLDSLSAGPGENLLKEWYRSRKKIDSMMRHIVKRYVKEVLLDVGRGYAVSKFGGLEGGPLPSFMLKPYEPGDDPSLVDLEESIENILAQGKIPKYLRYEDLLMREEERGKIAIVLLNDISGSMAGEKLFYMSICSLMLLYAFRREDLAVAFFESDTYKVKNIDENINIEDIADELLDLEAFGGTCVSRALLWAEEQFNKTKAKAKALVLLSDCAFYDYEEALALTTRLKRMNTLIFVVTPKWSYEENIVKALRSIGTVVVHVNNLEELPDILTTITNSI